MLDVSFLNAVHCLQLRKFWDHIHCGVHQKRCPVFLWTSNLPTRELFFIPLNGAWLDLASVGIFIFTTSHRLGQHFSSMVVSTGWFLPPLLPSSYLAGTLRLFICSWFSFFHAFWYDATGSGPLLHFLSAYRYSSQLEEMRVGINCKLDWLAVQFPLWHSANSDFQDSEIAGLLTRPFCVQTNANANNSKRSLACWCGLHNFFHYFEFGFIICTLIYIAFLPRISV